MEEKTSKSKRYCIEAARQGLGRPDQEAHPPATPGRYHYPMIRTVYALLLALGPSTAHAQTALDTLRFQAGVADAPAPAATVVDTPGQRPPESEVARAVFNRVLSEMKPDRREILRSRVEFHFIPEWRPLLAVIIEDFRAGAKDAEGKIAALRISYAQRLAEPGNRTPLEPRGYTTREGAAVWVFVGIENILATNGWDANGSRAKRVLVHELGHAVQSVAMSDAERAELRRLVIAYKATGPTRYSEGEEDELFAVASEIWFGVHQVGLNKPGWDTTQPYVELAPVMRFLERIYGPSRPLP